LITEQLPKPNITDAYISEISEIAESVGINSSNTGPLLKAGAKVISLLTANPTEEQKAEIRKEIASSVGLLVDSPDFYASTINSSFLQDPENQEALEIIGKNTLLLTEINEDPAKGFERMNNSTVIEEVATDAAKILDWYRQYFSEFGRNRDECAIELFLCNFRSNERTVPVQQ
jgi:hypothetical protein